MAISSTSFQKGHPVDQKTRDAVSRAQKGNTNRRGKKHTESANQKNRAAHLGRKSKHCGENHWNWKGGITPLRKKAYFQQEYKDWRVGVFERDCYTCVICGVVGGELNADHIKPWAFFPELRFSLENGRTLCISCHRKTTTWGNRKWAGGAAPTLTTTASKADMLGFVVTSSGNYDGFVVGQNI